MPTRHRAAAWLAPIVTSGLCLGAEAALAQTPTPIAAARIKHIVIIMQENRSFDTYFGTYPGADGLPPDTCVPLDPTNPGGGCVRPFHDPLDVNAGGPHGSISAQDDLDDGITHVRQDGYVLSQTNAGLGKGCKEHPNNPGCAGTAEGVRTHDVMGYHTAEDIPNYWAYARDFVLQDHMFEGVRTWSWPSHIDLTSEWVAACADKTKAATCETASTLPFPTKETELPWANLFQLLDAHSVTWKYYLGQGTEPDCEDDDTTCAPQIQTKNVPSIWNPAPFYKSVKAAGPAYLAEHVPDVDRFLADIHDGSLPQVSWIVPNGTYSEHPPAGVTTGMEYVTSLVNAVMASPYWDDTAIFITWDDWGGFFDHETPPIVDRNDSDTPIQGFGIRVPGLLVSAHARQGYIDHGVLSFDSYATFIEDVFMDGARLDPAKLGEPDKRPDMRDAVTRVRYPDGQTAPVSNLADEFDFSGPALPPLILSTHIPTGIATACGAGADGVCGEAKVTVSWNAVGTGFTYGLVRDGALLEGCDGTATNCVDQPGPGEHFYRVFSVDPYGERSPVSAAADAVVK